VTLGIAPKILMLASLAALNTSCRFAILVALDSAFGAGVIGL
jgi:hypothetical protein